MKKFLIALFLFSCTSLYANTSLTSPIEGEVVHENKVLLQGKTTKENLDLRINDEKIPIIIEKDQTFKLNYHLDNYGIFRVFDGDTLLLSFSYTPKLSKSGFFFMITAWILIILGTVYALTLLLKRK